MSIRLVGRVLLTLALIQVVAMAAETPAIAPDPVAPTVAVPDQATRERMTKEVRALYKTEFASRKTEERVALARKLIDQGKLPGDAASRFVMLSEGCDLAMKAGETELALEAVEAVILAFRIDAEAERLRCLAGLAQSVGSLDQAGAAISAACARADAAVQRDDYPGAVKAIAIAEQIARRARDPGLQAQARAQSEQIKALSEAWNDIGEVEDPLGGITAEGHGKLGRFLALVKGDWAAALPHLAASDDPLQKTASDELTAADAGAAARVAVADAWFELAGKQRGATKATLFAHSASLYRLALDGISGLERARVDKRLGDLDRLYGGRASSRRPPGAVLFLSFERDTLALDGGKSIALDSSGRGLRARITGAKPVSGAFGTALEFGPEPSTVDCGSAKELSIIGSMSLSMWLKPTVLGLRRNPFNKSYGAEGTITLEPLGVLNYFYGTAGADGNPYQSFPAATPIKAGAWVHTVLVRDLGPAQRLTWYLDGRRCNDAAATYPAAKASSQPFLLGQGYTGMPFIGLIDEVGLWPRALSDAEVKQLHEVSAAGR